MTLAPRLTFYPKCFIIIKLSYSLGFAWVRGVILTKGDAEVPCGRKRKLRKIATHKRKKKLRKNRHKNK
jgi:hypothetical protein